MRKVLLAALLAGSVATPAFAQTTGGPFTGFRVEGILGYDSVGFSADDDVDDIGGDDSLEGIAYGLGLGFDFDAGGVVIGVEGEYVDSTGDFEFDDDEEDFTATLDVERDLYIGGRVGFSAGASTLIYGKLGYTNLKLGANIDDGVDDLSDSDTVDGYRLGAGIEQLFGPNAYGKVEYRYSNYGSFGDDDDFGEVDLDRHQFMIGFGWRFR